VKVKLERNGVSEFGRLLVEREQYDPNFKTESTLLYHIKLALIEQGYDVIKKRMWKDGHMYGDETTQYIRSRDMSKWDSFMIFDGDYAIRQIHHDFNNGVVFELYAQWNKPLNV
jgi:hypothetical protein